MKKREQGATPTPAGFKYYRQGLHTPATLSTSRRRGKVLHKMYNEINKSLQAHAEVSGYFKAETKDYSKGLASRNIEHHTRAKGDHVTEKERKQAIAIGISQARRGEKA